MNLMFCLAIKVHSHSGPALVCSGRCCCTRRQAPRGDGRGPEFARAAIVIGARGQGAREQAACSAASLARQQARGGAALISPSSGEEKRRGCRLPT